MPDDNFEFLKKAFKTMKGCDILSRSLIKHKKVIFLHLRFVEDYVIQIASMGGDDDDVDDNRIHIKLEYHLGHVLKKYSCLERN